MTLFRKPHSSTNGAHAALLALLALVALPAAAQPPGTTVFTKVIVDSVEQAACTATNMTSGASYDSGTRLCDVALINGAWATVQGRAVAPAPFDPNNPAGYQLPEVGAASRVSSVVTGTPGPSAPPSDGYSPTIKAYASGQYLDYLILGSTRPSYLELRFTLSGSLSAITNFPYPASVAFNTSEASASYAVAAQSGVLYPDGTFGSRSPYRFGEIVREQVLRSASAVNAAAISTTVTYYGDYGNYLTLEHWATPHPVTSGLTNVLVRLGSEFFDNPA